MKKTTDPEILAWQEEVREYKRTGQVSGLPVPRRRDNPYFGTTGLGTESFNWNNGATANDLTEASFEQAIEQVQQVQNRVHRQQNDEYQRARDRFREPPPNLPRGITAEYAVNQDATILSTRTDHRGRRLRDKISIAISRQEQQDYGPAVIRHAIRQLEESRRTAPLEERHPSEPYERTDQRSPYYYSSLDLATEEEPRRPGSRLPDLQALAHRAIRAEVEYRAAVRQALPERRINRLQDDAESARELYLRELRPEQRGTALRNIRREVTRHLENRPPRRNETTATEVRERQRAAELMAAQLSQTLGTQLSGWQDEIMQRVLTTGQAWTSTPEPAAEPESPPVRTYYSRNWTGR